MYEQLLKWRDTLLQRLMPGQVESLPAWRMLLTRTLQVAFAVVRDFLDGQLTLRAMSLVYTTLLSLVPLLALTFSVLKGFGVHNQLEPLLLGTLSDLGRRARRSPGRSSLSSRTSRLAYWAPSASACWSIR